MKEGIPTKPRTHSVVALYQAPEQKSQGWKRTIASRFNIPFNTLNPESYMNLVYVYMAAYLCVYIYIYIPLSLSLSLSLSVFVYEYVYGSPPQAIYRSLYDSHRYI